MVVVPQGGSRLWKILVITTLSVTFLTTGCVYRKRVIKRQGALPNQQLLTASKDTLLLQIAERFKTLQTLNATVDLLPSIGSAGKGSITEYKDVRGYILYRQPEDIRVIGLYPVVRGRAFDMVSDGSVFRLFLPAKNLFIQGNNVIGVPSKNKLENLRPQHFLDALIVRPPDAGLSTTMINLTDEDQADYIIEIIDVDQKTVSIKRQLWFDRLNLRLSRQLVFNADGEITSDTRYSGWQIFDGIEFPKQIDINRPLDEYGVQLVVQKLEANVPLEQARFELTAPEGSDLRVLGSGPASGGSENLLAPSKGSISK